MLGVTITIKNRRTEMKKLYYAALLYAILGLGLGLFFREYTKAHDFTGFTQLAIMHTHLFALGMIVMLIVLVFERVFELSKSKWLNLFFWHYNAGVLLTVAMMLIIGMREVAGQASTPMLSGIAGLGHILITVALLFFFMALGKRVLSAANRSV